MSSLEERLDALELRLKDLESTKSGQSSKEAFTIPEFCTIGNGVRIDPTVVFKTGAHAPISVGDGTRILRGGEWMGPITVGEQCYFNRNSYVRANVTIGDRVNVGPFVQFVSDTHEVGPASRRAGKNLFPPIRVGDGTWIGAGAIITGGVTIGESCIVAAGAVVVSDIPPNSVVGGVPGKVIRALGHETSEPKLGPPVS